MARSVEAGEGTARPSAFDGALVTAIVASLALAATLFFVPDATWRAPLALLAGIWAPGYAIVALLYRRGRLSQLERHALAVGLGIVALPLLGLAASLLVGFRPTSVSGATVVITLGAGAAAAMRRPFANEPIARSPAPSRRATAAIVVGALLLAAAVLAPTLVARDAVPHALALTDARGAPLDLTRPRGETFDVLVEASSGSAPVAGRLIITWGSEVLVDRDLALEPGAHERIDLALTLDATERKLSASWEGREVHATFAAEGRR